MPLRLLLEPGIWIQTNQVLIQVSITYKQRPWASHLISPNFLPLLVKEKQECLYPRFILRITIWVNSLIAHNPHILFNCTLNNKKELFPRRSATASIGQGSIVDPQNNWIDEANIIGWLEAVQEAAAMGRCQGVGLGSRQWEMCLAMVEGSPYDVYRFPRQYFKRTKARDRQWRLHLFSLSPLPQPPSPSLSHSCGHHGKVSEHRDLERDLGKSFLTLTLWNSQKLP